MAPRGSDFGSIEPDLFLAERFEDDQQTQKPCAAGLHGRDVVGTHGGAYRPVLLGEDVAQRAGIHGKHGGDDQDGGGDSVHGTGNSVERRQFYGERPVNAVSRSFRIRSGRAKWPRNRSPAVNDFIRSIKTTTLAEKWGLLQRHEFELRRRNGEWQHQIR